MKKYVITGTAYSGKTTLIDALAQEGFSTVPEPARILIQEGLATNSHILPWKDIDAFLEKLLEKHLQICTLNSPIFLDRGIPDELAYFKYLDKQPPSKYQDAFKNNHYDGVYLLETIPGYQTDEVRREPPEMVQKLRFLHEEAYLELGYDVIVVPVMPIQDRVNYVLNSVLESLK